LETKQKNRRRGGAFGGTGGQVSSLDRAGREIWVNYAKEEKKWVQVEIS